MPLPEWMFTPGPRVYPFVEPYEGPSFQGQRYEDPARCDPIGHMHDWETFQNDWVHYLHRDDDDRMAENEKAFSIRYGSRLARRSTICPCGWEAENLHAFYTHIAHDCDGMRY